MPGEQYCEHCDLPLPQCVHGIFENRTASTSSASESVRRQMPLAAENGSTRRSSKKTPQKEFRPYILRTLADHGGRAIADTVIDEIGAEMHDILSDGDYSVVSTGEQRWRNAIRWERSEMVKDGLIEAVKDRGTWVLTRRGRNEAATS